VAGKKGKKNFGFLFSIPKILKILKIPKIPKIPELRERSHEKKKVFVGLVSLVTHPSSIPLLGGLTPKFLSLSFHSL
jgi:hypothetical protein